MRQTPGPIGRIAVLVVLATMAIRAGAGTVEVMIQDYRYEPAELTVTAGTTVKWLNNEKRVSHSILFAGPEGFESERIFPGESWERTFDKPGTYPYSCGPHPEMHGIITVTR
ncbi:MAG: cupredoxin domain-containing protein [Gammaproteobacteria bacterium]|nr:cupredoxin domain-containing protein [Gammaproteobacteria bacterium]